MKAANAILLIMALQGSVALSQTTPTEKASASGTCSTAPVGDNNAYNINCNGTGVDQGKKIVEILNSVLANQDLTTVNAKLYELIVVASQPAQTQALQAPPNILGLTVTPLAPRPNIGIMGLIEGPLGINPRVTVTFTVDGMFPTAMFSVVCDRSCPSNSGVRCAIWNARESDTFSNSQALKRSIPSRSNANRCGTTRRQTTGLLTLLVRCMAA
jgi:hypothetical protein